MAIAKPISRALGTMVAYGFAEIDLGADLALAHRLGVTVLEIFPEWRLEPDPIVLRNQVSEAGLTIHSAHGCWGGQSIRAARVDLGHPDPTLRQQSVEDLKRCLDWIHEAGGTHLVVHPGGLSTPEEAAARRDALGQGLTTLAGHAAGSGVFVCVENMPPGVHPGSRMADLTGLVAELNQPGVALALDTGHAHLSADVSSETLDTKGWLRTTHVHDNDGRQDTHLSPGSGTIDWGGWVRALDKVDYHGPIMLECVRHLRKHPDCFDERLRTLLSQLVALPGPRSTSGETH